MLKENLTGLVVCGGRSGRMGTDKSKIIYHGKQQRYYLYEMLSQFCSNVYISCNEEQALYIDPEYNFIVDDAEYAETGPAAAMLSAIKKYPNENWLAVACDYPFIDENSLQSFLAIIKDDTVTAAFYSPEKKVYEPYLGFYSKESMEQLNLFFAGGNYSLNDFLKLMYAKKHVADKEEIKNVNTPEEMKAAKQFLKMKQKEKNKSAE